jgi:hypothetical protein
MNVYILDLEMCSISRGTTHLYSVYYNDGISLISIIGEMLHDVFHANRYVLLGTPVLTTDFSVYMMYRGLTAGITNRQVMPTPSRNLVPPLVCFFFQLYSYFP